MLNFWQVNCFPPPSSSLHWLPGPQSHRLVQNLKPATSPELWQNPYRQSSSVSQGSLWRRPAGLDTACESLQSLLLEDPLGSSVSQPTSAKSTTKTRQNAWPKRIDWKSRDIMFMKRRIRNS